VENLLATLDQNKRNELAKDVVHKFNLSKDFYSDKFALFQRLYKEYKAMRDDSGDDDDWSIKIALAYGIVESIVARISQTVLGKLSIETKPKKDNHKRQADNYHNMARTYFGSPDYRLEYVSSCRERVICGLAWEFDEWVNEYEEGFRWAKGAAQTVVDMKIPLLSSAVNVARKVAFKGHKLVKHKFPVNVGYNTRFPSIFSVFPQPGIIRVKDLSWIIEEVPYKTLADLEKCTYTDDSGSLVPVYDLSEIKKLKDSGIRITPDFPENDKSLSNFKQALEGSPAPKDKDKDDGIDALHLLIIRTKREITVVANGRYVIQNVKDLYHKPGLKVRARYYTQSNHSIYGMGAIEPIIDSLNEYSDVHSLSMQDWFRNINQMVAYDESAFPYPDDFDSRAGGNIRAAAHTDLNKAMLPIAKRDNTGSMITAQSGIQGNIESIVSVAEMTPGTMGTRPYHSTFGGLMEIQSSMARRFGIMMNIDQCNTMKQMEEMYWIYEQFMFEPMAFQKFAGGIGAVSYKREDIDTDGEGFLFVASDDPSFGDTQVQRNQALVLLGQSLAYSREQKANPKWAEIDGGEVFKWVLETFGKGDSSKILVLPDGSMDPDKEYEMMLQGVPVDTHPKENKSWHLIKHMIQKKMLENDRQFDPKVMSALITHISQTRADIQDVVSNPEAFAAEFYQEEAMKGMTAPGIAAPNMGQNLPVNNGMAAPAEQVGI